MKLPCLEEVVSSDKDVDVPQSSSAVLHMRQGFGHEALALGAKAAKGALQPQSGAGVAAACIHYVSTS